MADDDIVEFLIERETLTHLRAQGIDPEVFGKAAFAAAVADLQAKHGT